MLLPPPAVSGAILPPDLPEQSGLRQIQSGAGPDSVQRDLQSADLSKRIAAVRALASTSEVAAEKMAEAFRAEPRSVDWKPGQASLRLEVVAALSKVQQETRRTILTSLLLDEVMAASEDLAGGYPQSPMFTSVVTVIGKNLGDIGTRETLATLDKVIADPTGLLPREVVVELSASTLAIRDRLEARTSPSERAHRALEMLSGRHPSVTDERGVRGLTDESRREYGAQVYLIRLGASVIKEVIALAKDEKALAPVRAESAWLAAGMLQQASAQDEMDGRSLSTHVTDVASLLYDKIHPEDSLYVDEAMGILARIPETLLQQDAIESIQALKRRVVDVEQHMTRRQLAEKLLGLRGKRAGGPEEPSDRAQQQIGRLQQEPVAGFEFLDRYLQDPELSVREAAIARFRIAMGTPESKTRLGGRYSDLLTLFDRFRGDVATTTGLATVAAELCVDEPDVSTGAKVIRSLTESKNSVELFAATLVVRLIHDDRLLGSIERLLSEKNTWVRRCAEETYEDLGYRTWRGKVIGKLDAAHGSQVNKAGE
jgi:hypothetical protein